MMGSLALASLRRNLSLPPHRIKQRDGTDGSQSALLSSPRFEHGPLPLFSEASASWLAADARMIGLALTKGLLIEAENDS
jgi:hypothetical protein